MGPFELQEVVAVRPRATLWRATRAEAGGRGPREVVLRVAHDPADSEALAELRQEYDALRAVDDPRVRKTFGLYAGHGALAMEYIDGVSLAWVLKQVADRALELDLSTRVDLLVEVANALRVTHDAGVVHGRICADTVRLRRDGNVVITDFALPLDRLVAVPPEVASGGAATVATDQWLFGALACQVLTGEPLLGGEPGAPADGRRDAAPWVARVEAASPRLGKLVAKALARDPRARFGSEGLIVKELLAALRECADPPRRDLVARKAHLRRPRFETGVAPRPPSLAARPDAPRPPSGPVAAPWNPRAVSFEQSHDLVDAVVDDDAVTTPAAPPVVEAEPPSEEPEVPAPPRMVPDWVAAWALVMLLAVGLWAIVTRIF